MDKKAGVRRKKGILIVLEGIDGSGKTTQAKILLKKLRKMNFEAVYFREPSRGRWGREIKKKAALADSLSPEEELELFQKDRMENVEKNLKPALERGKIVILDRYYFSTIAYQGAKGIDPGAIQKRNEIFALRPDLVFILDIPAHQGLSRIQNRRKKDLLFEREEYLAKVREIFQTFRGKNIIFIDASDSKQAISSRIESIVFPYLARRSNSKCALS